MSARERLRIFYSETIGMRLAGWLEKRHPDWCWAEICTNVGLGYEVSWLWNRSAREKSRSAEVMCKGSDYRQNGACWCGKFTTPEFDAMIAERNRQEAEGKGFDL